MKQTIEIDIPDGWEFVKVMEPSLNDAAGSRTIKLKKKQQKDFNYFVDEYLSSSNTTIDYLTGWINDRDIEVAKNRLKTKQFNLVCWEIKIGLFKFICDDFKYDLYTCLTYSNRFVTETFMFIPKEFIDDLFKTKTN